MLGICLFVGNCLLQLNMNGFKLCIHMRAFVLVSVCVSYVVWCLSIWSKIICVEICIFSGLLSLSVCLFIPPCLPPSHLSLALYVYLCTCSMLHAIFKSEGSFHSIFANSYRHKDSFYQTYLRVYRWISSYRTRLRSWIWLLDYMMRNPATKYCSLTFKHTVVTSVHTSTHMHTQ